MGDEKKRKSLFGKMKKILDQINAHTTTPLDLHTAATFLERAQSQMKDCEAEHYLILTRCVDDAAFDVQEKAFEPIEAQFVEIKSKLRAIIQDLTPSPTRSSPSSSSTGGGTKRRVDVKLPRKELATFDGSYENWPSFMDLFKADVHDVDYTPAQKLQFLKAALQKEPAALIKSLTITDAHYQEALDILTARYDNKREIISALISKMLNYKTLTNESTVELQKLIDNTSEVLRALRVMGEQVETWDSFLVVLHVNKLDSATKREWAIRQTTTAMPTFTELTTFINNHVRGLLAAGANATSASSTRKNGDKPSSIKTHHSSSPETCVFCKGDHHHYRCSEFVAKTPTERSSLARKNKLCYNCLNRDHHLKDCRSKSTCRKCQRKHHTLLHEDRQPQQTQPGLQAPPTPAEGEITTHHAAVEVRTLLKTALVRVEDCKGDLQPVRIFLDDGSEGSLITETCVQRLGIRREKSKISIGGVGGTSAGTSRGKVNLNLFHMDTSTELTITAHIMARVTDHLPRRTLIRNRWSHIEGLQLADPEWYRPEEVDILVGSDFYNFIVQEGFRRGPPNTPSAQNTIFGWVLSGTSAAEPESTLRIHHATTDLDAIIRRFWEVEEPARIRILTKEEKLVEQHFIENYSRDIKGHFVVAVPFNEKKQDLGASRAMAVNRWKSVEKRLHRNPAHLKQYFDFMKEYEALGHMVRIPSSEAWEVIGKTYYLPHHHVINEGSSTTKLRVVFDGSARTSTGVSLNDAQLVGATLQDDLFDLLLRFRLHSIAIKADITKMFRQFRLKPEDADFHRVVWREAPDQPIQDYRLLTVTYGTACAPNLAVRCVQQLSVDCKEDFPLASAALGSNTYVDDVMASAKTSNEGLQLYHQLTGAVATAGLQLRKWSTNDPTLLAKIPENERETSLHSFDNDETVKALGVQWCPSSDNFTFKCVPCSESKLTKRVLLSDLSKVFDPIGFLSCVTVRAKLQMQELWKQNIDWDEEAPPEVQEVWKLYQEEMKLIPQVKIPRCMNVSDSCTYQLHGYCDSSTIAYGCVIYLRTVQPNGTITVNFVTSKTKVAPLKQITLPRLELMGACMLSELIDHVKQTLSIECEVWCWSDSTITLKWIASSSRRWQTFVANRVAKIHQHTEVEQWKHVPGVQNPADLASRGVSVEDIINSTFWFKGPEWLSQSQFPTFPMNSLPEDTNLEERKVFLMCHHLQTDTTIMERFSSLIRLKRVTAIIRRVISRKKDKPSGPLTVTELEDAFLFWTRRVQQQAFGEDIYQLQRSLKVPSKSKLLSLYPFIDGQGILRVGGRLSFARIDEAKKHQIILPADSHLTMLIIHHHHNVHFHGGFQVTWASVQSRFWILRGRDKVRHLLRKCVTCRRHRGKTAEQLMGNLPSPRITPSRPFMHVGVDYAGPFLLKNPIGRAPKTYKAYMCLFVCMATKAIHLEAVSTLSTAAFIETLRRFVSRRGIPAHLYSDCGTNFVGAEKELKQHIRSPTHQRQINDVLVSQGIQFHFNPPSSPHQGGLWEAGVKSAKFHLRRVVGSQILTYEVFSTFLCQVEAILNSRPLHPMSPDPDDLTALTPGHFLIGEPLTSIPTPDVRDIQMNRLTFYQQQQQRLQHFWNRWSTEYLNTLQQRNKWKWQQDNVQVGDLVLIKEETSIQQWRMGRIIRTHPGNDGQVRVVTLKTATGELLRPVVKLIPLLSSS